MQSTAETPYLDRLHRALCVAEPPLDPPYVDEATYDRNVRNSCREDAIVALGTVISRMDELDYGYPRRLVQEYLEGLQQGFLNDMEQS